MIPKYNRPAAPVSSTYPDGPTATSAAADIHWRDFFTDPRLKRMVELSLKNNRNLRVAALNVELYEAQYRIQRSALFPTVAATGSFTRARAEGTTTNEWNVGVGVVSYELDFFGRLRSLSKEALEIYLASAETRRSTVISLVADVATQYLTLLDDQEQLALAQQTLTSYEASYQLIKLQFETGTTNALDLAEAESEVHTARVNVFEYQRLAGEALNYLVLEVGEPLPANLPSGRKLVDQGMLADIPAGLPSDLIARRPDILAAEHSLLSANASIGAARANFFPQITLTGSGGFASAQLSNLFSASSAVWSVGPSISVPIFNGGENQATLDVAKVNKRIQIAMYEGTVQTAFREVSDALISRGRYAFEVGAASDLVAADQKFYDLSMLSYKEGIETYVTVLIAEEALYTAKSNLITTRTNLLANLITLYKALGGGWQ